MACKDCLQNCDKIVSDQCVQYTGPAIPLLGICTGDQITIYEANVANGLLTALDGTGITPANVTLANCPFLIQLLGTLPPTLINLLQLLVNADCTLNAMIVAIQAQIAAGQSGSIIDTLCLTGLPTNPTQIDILQAVINTLCSLNTTVGNFPTTYVQISALTDLVTPIVNQIVSGGSTTIQYNSRMVPMVAYEYYGPLSNFDSNGVGISALGFTRVFLCNGNHGTPDRRGRVAVGAIRNVPGGSLDPAVDPTVSPNNPNWGLNDKAGETFHTLTVPEIPSHTHTVNDPGHTHIETIFQAGGNGGNKPVGFQTVGAETSGQYSTKSAVTGIVINATGGGQGHNNIQPTIAAYYIMYLP